MSSAVAVGLLITCLWGLNTAIEMAIARRAPAAVLIAWEGPAGAVIALALALAGAPWWQLPAATWGWLTAGAALRMLAWWAYWRALAGPRSSIAMALASTYTLPAVLLLGATGQTVSPWVLAAIPLAGLGLWVGSADADGRGRGLGWAALACLGWGAWAVCSWKASGGGTPLQLLGGQWLLAAGASSLLALALRRRGVTLRLAPPVAGVFLLVLMLGVGSSGLLYWALDHGRPGQLIVLTACYPLVALLLRLLVGVERWRLRTAVSVVLLSAGAALAALG